MKRSKFVRLMAAAVLILVFTGQCFADGNPFTDMDGLKDKDRIAALQEQGIIRGTADGKFEPGSSMTAAQGIQLLVNAFGLNIDNVKFIKKPEATDYFKKADNDAWYANALIIASLNSLNLSQDLDPNVKWTREEFSFYLVKTMERKGNLPMINLVPFTVKDSDQINILYSGAIQRTLLYQLTKLNTEGNFRPRDEITRVDAAVMVYNALQYLKAHPAPATK